MDRSKKWVWEEDDLVFEEEGVMKKKKPSAKRKLTRKGMEAKTDKKKSEKPRVTIRSFVQDHFLKSASTVDEAVKALAKSFPQVKNPRGSVKSIVAWVKSAGIHRVEEKDGNIKFVAKKPRNSEVVVEGE